MCSVFGVKQSRSGRFSISSTRLGITSFGFPGLALEVLISAYPSVVGVRTLFEGLAALAVLGKIHSPDKISTYGS